MEKMTVDEFVNTKVLPQFQPVVAMIRQLMKDYAPEVQEIMSYGIPSYRARRIVAVISPTKKDITFAFSRGAEFEDKYNLLQGLGHVSKHVKLKTPSDVSEEALRYYIHQALELDSK